jgi:hypothetical protein
MITVPDYPGALRESDRKSNFKEVFGRLTETVKSTLTDGDEIYVRKTHGFIAWKRFLGPDHGLHTRQWRLYFFWITYYNSFTFRLRGGYRGRDELPIRFWLSPEPSHYGYELSFCADDLPLVACPDLVCFVESTFDDQEEATCDRLVWRWPLFSHDNSFPHYAWSVAGEKEYERRRKIVEEYRNRFKIRQPIDLS